MGVKDSASTSDHFAVEASIHFHGLSAKPFNTLVHKLAVDLTTYVL